MLEWLTNRGQKTDHPMHSIEEAQRLLSGLPDDPLKAIEEATSWLTTITSATGFETATRIDVLMLVDESGQPLEPELNRLFLTSPTLTEFERLQQWQAALQFWERLADAYGLCLDGIRGEPKQLRAHQNRLPLLIVRIMRAYANQAKVRRLRYLEVPAQLWQKLFDLYRTGEDAGCNNLRVTAYAGETLQTTARQELLRALMLDAAAPESMSPPQTELAARITARFADVFLLKAAPAAGCNWSIDLAQPCRPELATGNAAPPATALFFGAGAAITKIQEVIRRLKAEPAAAEKRFGEEYSSPQKLAALNRVLRFWGEHPPTRSEPRRNTATEITVAHGFRDACRAIPRIKFRGWAEFVVSMDPKLKEKLGFDPAVETTDVPTEKWLQQDVSVRGLGVIVPRASESRIALGALCLLQAGGQAWRIGAVRRLYRDGEKRLHAGIELLGATPRTLWLRRVEQGGLHVDHRSATASSSIYDYLHVIQPDDNADAAHAHELLLAHGDFVPGLVYEAKTDDPRPQLRFEELLEQGGDFDRVRFSSIARDAGPVKN